MKKVLCILTNGFEELEAVGTIALLRRAGIQIDIHAIDDTQACGRFNLMISNLFNLKDVNLEDYDALFLPGGPHYAKLESNEDVLNIIDIFMKADKFVSAICAAPTILGHRGYLKGKNYTCFTSMDEDFGGTYVDQYAVRDGKIITGRSAAAVIDFAFEIISALLGEEKANEVKKSIYY